MKLLTLIPARSGSKRLKNKNIKDFSGKPLIFWTIEAAMNSAIIDKIIVSTDDEETRKISENFGVEVPYLRPAALARDDSTAVDVALHTISMNAGFTHLLYLQPTSPLRTAQDIENCVTFFQEKKAKSVLSVSTKIKNDDWCVSIDSDSRISDFGSHIGSAKKYCPNGALYLVEINWFMMAQTFMNNQSHAFIMPEERSIDIDYAEEFNQAQNQHSRFFSKVV